MSPLEEHLSKIQVELYYCMKEILTSNETIYRTDKVYSDILEISEMTDKLKAAVDWVNLRIKSNGNK